MIPVIVLLLIVGFVAVELLWVKYNGSPVPRPDVSAQPRTIGQGSARRFVVMGDSTAVSQGGDYEWGYAVAAAEYLARDSQVTWANVAVPGSRSADVAQKQLPVAIQFQPDIVLVAVGANDITHLTGIGAARRSLTQVIAGLRQTNPQVKIILTGSPDMGSVPRFPQPLRWYAGKRTQDFNRMVTDLAAEQKVTFAPIAQKTGPVFRARPELFAADKFHPTTQGYRLWVPVIIDSIAVSLE